MELFSIFHYRSGTCQRPETFFAGPADRATPVIRGFFKPDSLGDFTSAVPPIRIINTTAIDGLTLIHFLRFGHQGLLYVAIVSLFSIPHRFANTYRKKAATGIKNYLPGMCVESIDYPFLIDELFGEFSSVMMVTTRVFRSRTVFHFYLKLHCGDVFSFGNNRLSIP
jgi:hypothetical protein